MARKFFVGGNFKMYVGARRPPYPAMPWPCPNPASHQCRVRS